MVTSSIAIETRHKVLLVDDDAVSLDLMELMLAHEGHQVLRAENALAAMELLNENSDAVPDVLLVDLQMPGFSGDQLASKVRAMRNGSSRPLLLAMSATQAKDQQLLAFDGFLLKPLTLEDLRRAMDGQKPGRRSALRVVHSRRRSQNSTKAEPDQAGVLDARVVNKLLAMMPQESLNHIFAACLADTRAAIAKLEEYDRADNQKLIRETAHRIKGAAQMVGAVRLARLAAGLEAGGDKQAATRAVLNDLLSACNELEAMLSVGKSIYIRAPHHEPSNRVTRNT